VVGWAVASACQVVVVVVMVLVVRVGDSKFGWLLRACFQAEGEAEDRRALMAQFRLFLEEGVMVEEERYQPLKEECAESKACLRKWNSEECPELASC